MTIPSDYSPNGAVAETALMDGSAHPKLNILIVTSFSSRIADLARLHDLGYEASVLLDLAYVVESMIHGSVSCDLLLVDLDDCSVDTWDAVGLLLHLRRLRPTPTIICSETLSERGFVAYRLPIADASVRLPCGDAEIESCILSAINGFDLPKRSGPGPS